MNQMMKQMMNQSQVQMGSCAIKGFDESLAGAPKIWYEDNFHMAIKVAPNDTFAAVASALGTQIQNKTDENSEMASNAAMMKAKLNFTTKVTVLGFSFEGTDISITSSEGEQPISSRLADGDVFQVKVQYDIQIGGSSGASGNATTASAQQQQPNSAMPSSFATTSNATSGGAIQPGGGGCCVIL
jgi:hypothetical protein